ncbi:MAG: class I tRNA ligase family protein, partial [Burkholderiales bacterium]|nr:class I tRNA ligase family protein [Anaerolineae bacterium]
DDILRTVEVLADADISVPSIQGENTVQQLKHHLDIQRMSKSKGNVVNPDEWVARHGADAVRAYLMFGFDWTKGGPWDSQGIQGTVRWLNDIWEMVVAGPTAETGDPDAERAIERKVHQTIERVTGGLHNFSFNTSIAGLMGLRNDLKDAVRKGSIGANAWREAMRTMLLLMAPITPHIAEELWARLGLPFSIHQQSWPEYDATKAADDTTTLVVMKNGKPIDRVSVSANISEDDAKQVALESDGAKRVLNGGQAKRVIFIAGRDVGGTMQEPKVNIVV